MATENILEREDFKRCADFHGHICPGLAIGYSAARAALSWLEDQRAEDEEVVAIVETDACGSDAVQVLTGCTFGKGNLIYRDYGKQVFTFFDRRTGKGVRISLKPGVIGPDKRPRELMEKVREEKATEVERKEFRDLHMQAAAGIAGKDPKELFDIKEVEVPPPPKAVVRPSINCDQCGEPTMSSKLVEKKGMKICRDCAE